MKSRFIVLLLCIVRSAQAQTTENELWNSFQNELNKIIQIQIENESKINRLEYTEYNNTKFMSLLLNTSIEEKGMDFVAQNYGNDSLVLVRKFICSVFNDIAINSTDSSHREKAINYLLSYSLYPSISQFLLTDFNEDIKQKILKIFNKQYSEKELNFYATNACRYDTVKYNNSFRLRIQEYMREQEKKNKTDVSYQEASKILYQLDVSRYKENILNFPVYSYDLRYLQRLILNIGQLNIREAIPYLIRYANSDTCNEETRKYAIFALATMQIENYEDKAVIYFNNDSTTNDIWLAQIINSQKIWYAYINRLKSEKYDDKCPIAYITIRNLGNALKDFPKNYIRYLMEPKPDMIVPIELTALVTDECGMSTQTKKTLINPEYIKFVVDWMEANKEKYELQQKINKTF